MVAATAPHKKHVPKSGCKMISTQKVPMIAEGSKKPRIKVALSLWLDAKYDAKISTIPSLANSDGCTRRGPSPSHRCAPFTFTPNPGTNTINRLITQSP